MSNASTRVVLAHLQSVDASAGIVAQPLPVELPETKVIYRENPEKDTGSDLGRFGGDPEDVAPEGSSESVPDANRPVKLSPSGDEKVKGNAYRRTPDQKPPRRQTNQKSYTHEKNREYQQTFKDLNGERK